MKKSVSALILILAILLPLPADLLRAATLPSAPGQRGQVIASGESVPEPDNQVYLDAKVEVKVPETEGESAEDGEIPPLTEVTSDDYPYGLDGKRIFNPSPTRAVWLSALFPGLGQIYNRRYWKLPIIIGGYMGLAYGTSWNARMYSDYSLAYSDIMDDDPDTKSYLDFFPPNVDESTLSKEWLSQTFKRRKDYYRRNRDLCIICCVGLYLLCMLDAYVDASLTHFDVSDNLSMDVAPGLMINPGSSRPTPALHWGFTF